MSKEGIVGSHGFEFTTTVPDNGDDDRQQAQRLEVAAGRGIHGFLLRVVLRCRCP